MINNNTAMVIDDKETITVILSPYTKLDGIFTDIFNKNPKSIPAKVVSTALSFRIVSYPMVNLSSLYELSLEFVNCCLADFEYLTNIIDYNQFIFRCSHRTYFF